jgi:radical SAM protein (TIGR01212 family)
MVKQWLPMMNKRYNDLNTYLRSLFGCRVQKITVDAGFSCPNRDGTLATGGCIYCNTRGAGTGDHSRGLTITDQLLQGKLALSRRYKAKKFLAYFQSFSNTYAPVDMLQKLYDEALAVEDVVGLSIGTRPDCVDESVLELLQDYAAHHLVWIEYGLQSARDKTLELINRGHDVSCFSDTVIFSGGTIPNILSAGTGLPALPVIAKALVRAFCLLSKDSGGSCPCAV